MIVNEITNIIFETNGAASINEIRAESCLNSALFIITFVIVYISRNVGLVKLVEMRSFKKKANRHFLNAQRQAGWSVFKWTDVILLGLVICSFTRHFI